MKLSVCAKNLQKQNHQNIKKFNQSQMSISPVLHRYLHKLIASLNNVVGSPHRTWWSMKAEIASSQKMSRFRLADWHVIGNQQDDIWQKIGISMEKVIEKFQRSFFVYLVI